MDFDEPDDELDREIELIAPRRKIPPTLSERVMGLFEKIGKMILGKPTPTLVNEEIKPFPFPDQSRVSLEKLAEKYVREGDVKRIVSIAKQFELIGKLQQTDRLFEIALQSKSIRGDGLIQLLYVYSHYLANYGRLEDAEKSIGQILKLDPGNRDALTIRGYIKIKQDEPEDAIKLLKNVKTQDKSYLQSRFHLAGAHMMLEQYQDAEENLKLVQGNNMDWFYTLGLMKNKTGHRAEAIELFEKVIKMNPVFAPAYFMLSQIYLSMGDSHKAESAAAETIRLNPSIHEAYYVLASVLFYKGKFKEAGDLIFYAVKKGKYKIEYAQMVGEHAGVFGALDGVLTRIQEREGKGEFKSDLYLFLSHIIKQNGRPIPQEIARHFAEALSRDEKYAKKFSEVKKERFSTVHVGGVYVAKGTAHETIMEIKELRDEYVAGLYLKRVLKENGVEGVIANVIGMTQTPDGARHIVQETVERRSLMELVDSSLDDDALLSRFKQTLQSSMAIVVYGTQGMKKNGDKYYIEADDGQNRYFAEVNPYPLWENYVQRLFVGRGTDSNPRLGFDQRYGEENDSLMKAHKDYLGQVIQFTDWLRFFVHGDLFTKNVSSIGEIFDLGRYGLSIPMLDPALLVSGIREHMLKDKETRRMLFECTFESFSELRGDSTAKDFLSNCYERLIAHFVMLNIGSAMGEGNVKKLYNSFETAKHILTQQKQYNLINRLGMCMGRYEKIVMLNPK